MRKSKPITVTLGAQQESLDRRLASGAYSSASEILRAGLRALDREETALDDLLREKIRGALADPRPSVPARDVFDRLRVRHAAKAKRSSREA